MPIYSSRQYPVHAGAAFGTVPKRDRSTAYSSADGPITRVGRTSSMAAKRVKFTRSRALRAAMPSPIGRERLMYNRSPFLRAALSVAAALLLMTGCRSAMSIQSDSTNADQAEPSMFPLRFYHHGFAVHCYNTIRCQVSYYDHDFTRLFGDKRSGPPPSPDYRDKWTMATRSWIPNFPPPADVHWTSLDGVEHDAKVDIGAIFKDQRVLYRVPDTEIPDRSWGDDPSILLEVNDRTVNVYMKAFIATKTEQTPGNKDSDYRADVIRAWTHTY
jgi:hypothetical protein